MSHHNYPNHGRSPYRPSPTGGDSHSGSSYSEQGRTILPPLTIAFPTSDSPVSNNNFPNYNTTQRSTPVPYEQTYYQPAPQQPQPHAQYSTYPSYQQLSDARYHSGQTHSGSYNRASPSSSSADPWRPPPLSVPPEGGRWQGQQYYQSHADLQIPPASSDLRSPHSAYPQNFPQHQLPTSPAYAAGHSPRGAVPAVAAANTHYPQSMAMSHAALDRTMQNSRGAPHLPYARVPTAPSPVYDIPPETAEPTIKKKRKRADARQLEALNRMYARTAFPSTEERQQLARDLDMSARSVQIWFQNKRQASRQGGRNPASSSISTVTVTLPPDPSPVGHHRGSPAPMSPMSEAPYQTRSPLPAMMRSGQTPSPPSGRTRADIDPRTGRHYTGPSRGY